MSPPDSICSCCGARRSPKSSHSSYRRSSRCSGSPTSRGSSDEFGGRRETKQIPALIEQWAAAVHSGDMEDVLADHAGDIVMFDGFLFMLNPKMYG